MNEKRGRGRPRLSEEEKKSNALARRRGDLPSTKPNFGQENVLPGDNSKYLRHAMMTLDMPAIDTSDPQQVSERITWYFEHCIESDMKPTVAGLCNSLGICRNTLWTWRNGDFRGGTHQAIVQRAYRLLEELWEDYMLNGKINPVSGIFLGKNNFGYQDKQEYVVTPNTMGSDASPEVIEAKYEALPED